MAKSLDFRSASRYAGVSRLKRSVLAASIAAILALIGCAMIWLYVRGADARVMEGKEAARVLVATKRIPRGTTGSEIKKGNFVVVVSMPKSSVPSDALSSIDQGLEALAVNADIQTRQLLLRGSFGQPETTSGGLKIPEGKVAVSVPIINSAGTGYVEPGAKVAVFSTFTLSLLRPGIQAGDDLDRKHEYNHATRLLLPKAEVIAVGMPGQSGAATTSGKNEKSTEVVSKEGKVEDSLRVDDVTIVTVALTQEEAERLIQATQTGHLYIALLDDTSDLRPGPGITYDNLYN